VYDLAERLFPADLLARRVTEDEQRRHKLLSRYRAHGLLGVTGPAELWYGTGEDAAQRQRHRAALVDAGELVPVTVAGVRGDRHVLAGELPLLDEAIRSVAAGEAAVASVAFLAPLDPFAWDRDVLRSLFDFDYVWEVYVPAAKRRWGYYVLPILFGDDLVGRIEPRIERRAGAIRVVGLWWEEGFDPLGADRFVESFAAAIRAYADFGGATRIVWPRAVRHRGFVAAVRGALAGMEVAAAG
jgi:uncharacterized protein YcaQ